jgi:DNA-binding response OmpR family regulator
MHGPTIMRRLATASGRIVTRDALLDAMYPAAQADDAIGVLRASVCALRRRLPPGAIRTHVGEGYSLDPAVGSAWLGAREPA